MLSQRSLHELWCIMYMSCDMTKLTKWVCTQQRLRSAWASAQSDRVFTVRMKKMGVLSYPLSSQRRLWSDWVDAQADLSLCWAHSHFVCFVMLRLNYVHWPILFRWFLQSLCLLPLGLEDIVFAMVVGQSVHPSIHPSIGLSTKLLASSVGCTPAWYAEGRGFDPPVRLHSFVEIGHEIIFTAILTLQLIQVG